MVKKIFFRAVLFFLFFINKYSFSQQISDTISITLKQAEANFLATNLQLLSQKYSLDSAKANIITAKLFDNPEFSYYNGFYDEDTKKIFNFGNSNWEISAQVTQLIKTAGKRNKAIQLAQTGVQLTEYQFYELLRTLRFTLRNDFYNMYYLQQSANVYGKEILSLEKTTKAFEEQVKLGNIAQKELIRIKSQLYSLQAELVSLQNSIDDVQSEFKLLIRAKANLYVLPIANIKEEAKNSFSKISYQSLIDSAYKNRYDLKIAKANITLNQQNLQLQKALAVPDITAGVSYDRLGSFVHDFNSIGFSVPLPLFNKNQGNIKQANAMIEASKLQLSGVQDQLESQVSNCYLGAIRAEKLLNSFDQKFSADFDNFIGEVLKNFEKRNISILEFIDFYDSYKQNSLLLNNLKYNRVSQLEQLNFTTGTQIFN